MVCWVVTQLKAKRILLQERDVLKRKEKSISSAPTNRFNRSYKQSNLLILFERWSLLRKRALLHCMLFFTIKSWAHCCIACRQVLLWQTRDGIKINPSNNTTASMQLTPMQRSRFTAGWQKMIEKWPLCCVTGFLTDRWLAEIKIGPKRTSMPCCPDAKGLTERDRVNATHIFILW